MLGIHSVTVLAFTVAGADGNGRSTDGLGLDFDADKWRARALRERSKTRLQLYARQGREQAGKLTVAWLDAVCREWLYKNLGPCTVLGGSQRGWAVGGSRWAEHYRVIMES